MLPEYNEEIIVAQLQDPKHCREAFALVVRHYSQSLYWQIRKMVISHDDADDLLQNTFMKAWSSIAYFRAEAETATKGLSRRLIKSLNALGAYAHRCGGFELRELHDEVTVKAFSRLSEGFYSHIALTSPNGAEIFLKRLRESRIDIRKLSEVKIPVIGKGTGAKLEKAGLYADIMPEKFNSVALGNMLSGTLTCEDRLLIVRSSEGSAELVKPLAEKGLNFDDVHIYEPVYSTGEKIDDDYAVFASAGGVRSFFHGGGSLSENTKCISIGEVTAAELKKYGINGPLLPTESTAEGIIQKILSDK